MQPSVLVTKYLDQLTRELSFDPELSRRVRREVEDHLLDAIGDDGGDDPKDAAAIARFESQGDRPAVCAIIPVATGATGWRYFDSRDCCDSCPHEGTWRAVRAVAMAVACGLARDQHHRAGDRSLWVHVGAGRRHPWLGLYWQPPGLGDAARRL